MAQFAAEATGLKESIRLLGKVDKALQKEAVAVMRKGALEIKGAAQVRMLATPGVRRNGAPLTRGAIAHTANTRGAAVGINRASKTGRNAAIFPLEYGAHTQFVPWPNKRTGRAISQNRMRRRTFPVWRGNQFKARGAAGPGWIVQPLIRKMLPGIEIRVEAGMAEVFERAARKAGVPRGR